MNVIHASFFAIILYTLLTEEWSLAIVEDAQLPNKYCMLCSLVDMFFADVAQPDQARIDIHNAQSFLKDSGLVVVSIKASCIDWQYCPKPFLPLKYKLL